MCQTFRGCVCGGVDRKENPSSTIESEEEAVVGGGGFDFFPPKTGPHTLYVWYCLCAFPPVARVQAKHGGQEKRQQPFDVQVLWSHVIALSAKSFCCSSALIKTSERLVDSTKTLVWGGGRAAYVFSVCQGCVCVFVCVCVCACGCVCFDWDMARETCSKTTHAFFPPLTYKSVSADVRMEAFIFLFARRLSGEELICGCSHAQASSEELLTAHAHANTQSIQKLHLSMLLCTV